MENIRKLLKDAQEKMLRADHLAFMTYPQVKEPKMLALVVDNANAVFLDCMEALLCYERMYKRINPVKGDFDSELRVFRTHCCKRYGYPESVLGMVSEVKHLADKKRSCPVEFQRKESYMLCSEDYKLDSLNAKKVQSYVQEAKRFLNKTLEVVR